MYFILHCYVVCVYIGGGALILIYVVCNDVCARVEVGLLYVYMYVVLLCVLYCMYALLL